MPRGKGVPSRRSGQQDNVIGERLVGSGAAENVFQHQFAQQEAARYSDQGAEPTFPGFLEKQQDKGQGEPEQPRFPKIGDHGEYSVGKGVMKMGLDKGHYAAVKKINSFQLLSPYDPAPSISYLRWALVEPVSVNRKNVT